MLKVAEDLADLLAGLDDYELAVITVDATLGDMMHVVDAELRSRATA